MNNTDTTTKRAAIYARISLDRQEGAGVERQEQACRELAQRRGYDVVAVYVDNSVSAYSGVERPQYTAMLDAVKAGQVDVVLAWHVDRLTRSVQDTLDYIKLSNLHDLDTETVKDGVWNIRGAYGEMMATIMASVAQQESRHKAERIAAAYEQINLNGLPQKGGTWTFGYNDDHMTLREDEAQALRDTAEYILAGGTLYTAAKRLNAAGFKTTRGNEFTSYAVRALMTNPRLAGHSTHNPKDAQGKKLLRNRQVLKGRAQWAAVFTPEQHEQLTAILKDPKRVTNGGHNPAGRKPQYLGSGLFRCGCSECMEDPDGGRVLYCRWRKDKKRDYRKRMYYSKITETVHNRGHVSRLADPVDEYVESVVVARLSQPDIMERLAAANNNDKVAELTQQRKGIRDRMDGLENQFAAGNLDPDQFGRLNKTLLDQLEDVDKQMEVYAGKDTVLSALGQMDRDPALWWAAADLSLRRAVLDALCEVRILKGAMGKKVFVPDNEVRISWKI